MKIGELSKATGVSVRSLRYYEKQGLLTAWRTANGYREYSPFAAEQVQSIRLYLSLGLTTEQIAGFLHCVMKNKEAFCQEILPVYTQKLTEIENQIQLLSSIKSNLEERIEAIKAENPDITEGNENGCN
ncbi:MerR family transcriptional regulator [Paenibacillus sp. MBLB4367]|uniref:MerR family transcriptional regulator n=1 Tax=Paenibacillus sp. MBLB4367 TaxID=3384767 RepID=UPI003907F8DC